MPSNGRPLEEEEEEDTHNNYKYEQRPSVYDTLIFRIINEYAYGYLFSVGAIGLPSSQLLPPRIDYVQNSLNFK
jgi:hypothetical protein